MDACTNNACENGATCKVTEEDGYSCQCPNGFFGDNCEKGTAEKNGENWAAALVLLSHLFKKKRPEFSYIPCLNFIFLCFKLIILA